MSDHPGSRHDLWCSGFHPAKPNRASVCVVESSSGSDKITHRHVCGKHTATFSYRRMSLLPTCLLADESRKR